mgnify:CR=1 FL=1
MRIGTRPNKLGVQVQRIDLGQNVISRIEHQERYLKDYELLGISQALGADPGEFLRKRKRQSKCAMVGCAKRCDRDDGRNDGLEFGRRKVVADAHPPPRS